MLKIFILVLVIQSPTGSSITSQQFQYPTLATCSDASNRWVDRYNGKSGPTIIMANCSEGYVVPRN